jgi:hypothetical protein
MAFLLKENKRRKEYKKKKINPEDFIVGNPERSSPLFIILQFYKDFIVGNPERSSPLFIILCVEFFFFLFFF